VGGRKEINEIPSQPTAEHSDTCLSSQATLKAKSGRIMVSDQPEQNTFARPHLNRKKLGMGAGVCHPSDRGKRNIGLWSRLAWAKSETLSPK
jgi:hypothetical protein